MWLLSLLNPSRTEPNGNDVEKLEIERYGVGWLGTQSLHFGKHCVTHKLGQHIKGMYTIRTVRYSIKMEWKKCLILQCISRTQEDAIHCTTSHSKVLDSHDIHPFIWRSINRKTAEFVLFMVMITVKSVCVCASEISVHICSVCNTLYFHNATYISV